MEGGSCNVYDYVCGDPINDLDLTGLASKRALEDRDAECLGGTYAQITSDSCRAYQQAKVTGDSDVYYEGKTLTEPGKPNAFLTQADKAARATGRAAYATGKFAATTGARIAANASSCAIYGTQFAGLGAVAGGAIGAAGANPLTPAAGAALGGASGAVVGCAYGIANVEASVR